LEFFADGLPEKKLQLSGISMLLILLSRGGCYTSLEQLGSQGPLALSQKAHPPMMCIGVRWAVTPGAVVHFEVPADQWADDRCSCVRYGECEPSII
jgi:hypothetical protein